MALMKRKTESDYVPAGSEPVYLEGFVPSSWDSQHSSLQLGWTLIGAGLLLASLAGFGVFIYGIATTGFGGGTVSNENGDVIGVAGLIGGILVAGFAMWSIHHGRSSYRRYRMTTGRIM